MIIVNGVQQKVGDGYTMSFMVVSPDEVRTNVALVVRSCTQRTAYTQCSGCWVRAGAQHHTIKKHRIHGRRADTVHGNM